MWSEKRTNRLRKDIPAREKGGLKGNVRPTSTFQLHKRKARETNGGTALRLSGPKLRVYLGHSLRDHLSLPPVQIVRDRLENVRRSTDRSEVEDEAAARDGLRHEVFQS